MKKVARFLLLFGMASAMFPVQSKSFKTIYVAAYNALETEKNMSDYVCTGTNDEMVFKKALDQLKDGGTIKLSSGDFHFDSFGQNPDGVMPSAVCFDNTTPTYKIYTIEGVAIPMVEKEENNNFTKIKISDKCFDALDDEEQVAVFRSVDGKVKFNLAKLAVHAKSNSKPIIYVNAYYSANVNLEDVRLYNDDFDANHVPNKKCIGVCGTNGSNPGVSYEWKKVFVFGFHEGFRCQGEHLILWQCGTRNCYYGYTFAPYQNTRGAYTHPITLINCCDELSAHMPYFGPVNGEAQQTDMLGSHQAVTFIDFNLEWNIQGKSFRPEPPRYATEAVPGMFKGRVEYTIQSGYAGNSKNDKHIPFWAEGSGHGFISINQAHELAGPTVERLGYSQAKAANYMQTFYDTDLQKQLIFDGTGWRDFNGKHVD